MFLHNKKDKDFNILIRLHENYMNEFAKNQLGKMSDIKNNYGFNPRVLNYEKSPIYNGYNRRLRIKVNPVGSISSKNNGKINKI